MRCHLKVKGIVFTTTTAIRTTAAKGKQTKQKNQPASYANVSCGDRKQHKTGKQPAIFFMRRRTLTPCISCRKCRGGQNRPFLAIAPELFLARCVPEWTF